MENTTFLIIYILGAFLSSVLGYLLILFYIPPAKRDESVTIAAVMITGLLSWLFVSIAILSAILGILTLVGSKLISRLIKNIEPKPMYSNFPNDEDRSWKEEVEEKMEEEGLKKPLKKDIRGKIK